MSRIDERFAACRAAGRPAFVAYLTAGEPSPARTVAACLELERGGADVIELGVPFSDPIADGPVIQRASERALARGTTLAVVLDLVRQARAAGLTVPVVLFSYLNPLLRFGLRELPAAARAAGCDGALVTDLPPEGAGQWIDACRAAELDTVFLAAPTSPPERLAAIADASRGFVYAVSRTGVTGEQVALSDDARPLVERLRAGGKPVALGFGIATPEQVAAAGAVADGVVVGSALVRFLEEHPEGDLAERVRWLRSATETPR
ncbi:MAG: tryptophan synthase subunit alpha [Vicinamibacteria bacterium]|nr:tryptophan synthase subunit alpha [Vicinamibacteria bacterium]